MTDPDRWPVAPVPDEPKPDDEDRDDIRELHRVFDDERSGPRPGRRIEWRDSGDRQLTRRG